MTFLGIVFCLIGLALVFIKISFIIFGESAKGTIIGYDDHITSTNGISSHPYRVRFESDGETYIARSIESASGSFAGAFSDENINREVTVFYKKIILKLLASMNLKAYTSSASLFFY